MSKHPEVAAAWPWGTGVHAKLTGQGQKHSTGLINAITANALFRKILLKVVNKF